jgi:hypothetical protein
MSDASETDPRRPVPAQDGHEFPERNQLGPKRFRVAQQKEVRRCVRKVLLVHRVHHRLEVLQQGRVEEHRLHRELEPRSLRRVVEGGGQGHQESVARASDEAARPPTTGLG